jgi:hypothetical protein
MTGRGQQGPKRKGRHTANRSDDGGPVLDGPAIALADCSSTHAQRACRRAPFKLRRHLVSRRIFRGEAADQWRNAVGAE